MIKQFLLNPDGSIPEGTDVALLQAEGIPLVLPTSRPKPEPGFIVEECEPEQTEDGIWRQAWAQVQAPPAIVSETELSLEEQVQVLLARVAQLEGN